MMYSEIRVCVCIEERDDIHCTVPVVKSDGHGVSSMHRVVHAQAQNPRTPVKHQQIDKKIRRYGNNPDNNETRLNYIFRIVDY